MEIIAYSLASKLYDSLQGEFSLKNSMPFIGDATTDLVYQNYSYNGKIYIAKWDEMGNFEMREYTILTDTWATKAIIASKNLSRGVSNIIGDKIYYFGGLNTYKDAIVYNITNNTWTVLTSSPQDIGGTTCEVINGVDIYVFGAESFYAASKQKIKIYHTLTNTWEVDTKALMPTNAAITFSVGDRVFAISDVGTGFREYVPASDTWVVKASLKTHRLCLIALGTKYLYAFGADKLSERYDIANNKWTASVVCANDVLGAASTISGQAWCVTNSKQLYLFGGTKNGTLPYLDKVVVYDTDNTDIKNLLAYLAMIEEE